MVGQTQWRTASLSTLGRAEIVKTGLDYPAVRSAARWDGIRSGPDDFRRLRVLEGEALSAWQQERQTRR